MSGFYVDVDEMLSMINKVVYEELERAPLPDVREVKHAQWMDHAARYRVGNIVREYVCSNCYYVSSDDEMKYCPECGAKMDGGKNEKATDL